MQRAQSHIPGQQFHKDRTIRSKGKMYHPMKAEDILDTVDSKKKEAGTVIRTAISMLKLKSTKTHTKETHENFSNVLVTVALQGRRCRVHGSAHNVGVAG